MAGLLNAKEYMKKYKARSIWHKALTCMAAVVVFCTTYALVLPALTLERPADCGYIEHVHNEACYVRLADDTAYEEQTGSLAATLEGASAHQHTEDCYAIQQGELICTQSTEAAETHNHTAECYEETKTLVCSLEESEGHTHGDGCYDEDGELVCGMEESEGHAHDDSCYETNSELVCELSEEAVEPHQHTAECYAQEKVLICTEADPEITDSTEQSSTGSEGLEGSEELTCGKAEGEGAHIHGEGCYNEDGQLICTKAEYSGHQHNQFCYGWELICELEEHTHTDACFPVTDEEEEPEVAPGADPTADVEAAADWEATLPSDLPENGAEAVIAVAESQLGYHESADNFIIYDANGANMKKGYTRYGAWYGNPYGDWCAMFVSFCLHYGGVTDFPLDASCPNWVEKLQAEDLYRASGDYTPKAGDLVFYDHDGDGRADHVGLVSELLTEEQLAGENLAGDWEPDDQLADQEPAGDTNEEQNTDNTSADSATAPSADENTAAEPSTEPAAEPAIDTVMAAVPSVDSAITEELMAEEPLIMGQFANQLMAETAIAEYHATGNVVSGDTEATDRVASQNVTQAQQPAKAQPVESQPTDSTPDVEQPADEPQTGEASADQAIEANDADQSAAAEEAPVVAIKTIEGNVGNQVQYQVHRIDDERILGYGVLPDTAPNKTAPNTFQWNNDDITVTVSLPEDAALPADTRLQVRPIAEDTEGSDYAERYQQVVETAFSNGESKMESLNLYKMDLVSQGKVIEYKCNDEGKKAMVTVKQSDAHWPTTLRPVMAYFSGDSAALMKQNKDDDMQGTFETDLSAEFAVAGAQAALAPNTFQWSDSKVTVTVSLPEDAVLPADAHIEVEKILPEGAAAPTDSNTEEQPEDEPAAPDNSGDAQPLMPMPMALSLAGDTAVAPEDEAAATDSSAEAQPAAPEDEAAATDSAADAQPAEPEEETVANDSSVEAQPEAVGSEYDQKKQLLQETAFSNGESIMQQLDLYKINLVADGKVIDYPGTAKVTVELSGAQWPTTLCPVMLYFPGDSVGRVDQDIDEEGNPIGTFETDLSAEFAVAGAELLMNLPVVDITDQLVEDDAVTYHKTIDAFRDGAENPDTTLDNQSTDKKDLYRLYMDVQAYPTPVDLVIVVDQSGSMTDRSTEDGLTREQATRKVLNGTYTETAYNQNPTLKQDGLIYQFLAQNPENQVAVVEFHGKPKQLQTAQTAPSKYQWDENADPPKSEDASTLLSWTSNKDGLKYVNVAGQKSSRIPHATNYCAGLYQADAVLDQLKQNNGHKKVMVFISDGVPTQYLKCVGEEGYSYNGNKGSFIAKAGDWVKFGIETGWTGETITTTETCFDDLLTSHTGLTVHTIGLGKDAGESGVLQYMAQNGGGNCFETNTTEGLKSALGKLIGKCTNLKIEDTLSDYVTLANPPDYKVTMKRTSSTTGTENEDENYKVLYENGAVTTDGQGKLNRIDVSGKKVSAVFEQTYELEAGWTYTLSFNIQTEQAAYDDYAEKHVNPHTGAPNTDYGNNATSSGKPGYHSNEKATATYTRGGQPMEHIYPHPVVQVADHKLTVKKVWLSEDGSPAQTTPTGTIHFDLYRHVYETPPDTVTVSLCTQAGRKADSSSVEWASPQQVKAYLVKTGADATLTFQFVTRDGNSDFATPFRGLIIGENSVSNLSPTGEDEETTTPWFPWQTPETISKTYTYTYQLENISADTKICIQYVECDSYSESIVFDEEDVAPVSPIEKDELYMSDNVLSSETEPKWEKVFMNLPQSEWKNGSRFYYDYYVEETDVPEGYTAEYVIETGSPNSTITIQNKPIYQLPSTGGRGIDAYITAGLLLMTAAAMMLFYIKIWRRRGDSPTS